MAMAFLTQLNKINAWLYSLHNNRSESFMKKLFKTSTRILAALAVCAALSACGQVPSLSSAGNFPTYGGQASVSGQFVAPTIMDY